MSQKNDLKIYCDGGARGNPGPAASAFVVLNISGEEIHSQGFYLGKTTNNQAEYAAVLKAVEWVISSGMSDAELTFYLDSLLVVSQLRGDYKIKDSILRDYYFRIKKLIEVAKISVSDYVHIPRVLNYRADEVVNRTLDNIR